MELILVRFHYGPWHYGYSELLCQLLISAQILIPSLADGEESRVLGHPVGEMVFGQDREMGALGSGGSYELGSF